MLNAVKHPYGVKQIDILLLSKDFSSNSNYGTNFVGVGWRDVRLDQTHEHFSRHLTLLRLSLGKIGGFALNSFAQVVLPPLLPLPEMT